MTLPTLNSKRQCNGRASALTVRQFSIFQAPLFLLVVTLSRVNSFSLPLLYRNKASSFQLSSSASEPPKNLLDLSYLLNPSISSEPPIPFVDPLSSQVLECTGHYTVEYQNIRYTIATPTHHPVALICRTNEKEYVVELEDCKKFFQPVKALLPDGLELMEGPFVWTIVGDLDEAINNGGLREKGEEEEKADWNVEELSDILSTTSEEEDEAFFEERMRQILGDEVYESSADDGSVENIPKEFLEAFEGVLTDDPEEDAIRYMKEMLMEIDPDGDVDDSADVDDSNTEQQVQAKEEKPMIERLLEFESEREDGAHYTLVRILESVIVLGRDNPADQSSRLLLTPVETSMVGPKLEELCVKELVGLGIFDEDMMMKKAN